jgi:hypothetical protein
VSRLGRWRDRWFGRSTPDTSTADDHDLLKRAYGIDENAAGVLDLGDERNPDLGTLRGDALSELTDEELLWLSLERARRRQAD